MFERVGRTPQRSGWYRPFLRCVGFGFCCFSALDVAQLGWASRQPRPENALASQAVAAGTATAAMYNPAGALSILFAAQALSIWEGGPAPPPQQIPSPDTAPTIDPDLLAAVEDKAKVR